MTTRRRLLIGSLAFGALIASSTGAQAQSWTIVDYQPVHSASITPNRSPEVHTTEPANRPTPTQSPTTLPTPTATQPPTLTEEERQIVIQQVGTQELAYTGAEEWSTFALALGLVGSGLIITSASRKA